MRNLMSGEPRYRVLVTGSRGKSSLVRLLCAGFAAKGIDVRARVTGVLPREISPRGERFIVRNAPGHIEEMRWWLKQIPAGVEAVVMENSAVRQELQRFAADWLRPSLIVLTNARADHQEVWGEGIYSAARALLAGVPEGIPLIAGGETAALPRLFEILRERIPPAVVAPDHQNYRLANFGAACEAMKFLGLLDETSMKAMKELPPDAGDFRIFNPQPGTYLAAAFSANDVQSTERLFSLSGWRSEETSALFCDRADRPRRRAAFKAFLGRKWREVRIIRGGESPEALNEWLRGRQVFGCGNIAGSPLALIGRLLREGCVWTIPGG